MLVARIPSKASNRLKDMSNVRTFAGTYQVQNDKLIKDGLVITIRTRKNPKGLQSVNYLTCYPNWSTNKKDNYYLSGLYPTEYDNVFRLEHGGKYYHLLFINDTAHIKPLPVTLSVEISDKEVVYTFSYSDGSKVVKRG